MNVRSIYRWENPKKTGKWLALYIYLWYTQHVVTYLVSSSFPSVFSVLVPVLIGGYI